MRRCEGVRVARDGHSEEMRRYAIRKRESCQDLEEGHFSQKGRHRLQEEKVWCLKGPKEDQGGQSNVGKVSSE
jgi:hypothetical protein